MMSFAVFISNDLKLHQIFDHEIPARTGNASKIFSHTCILFYFIVTFESIILVHNSIHFDTESLWLDGFQQIISLAISTIIIVYLHLREKFSVVKLLFFSLSRQSKYNKQQYDTFCEKILPTTKTWDDKCLLTPFPAPPHLDVRTKNDTWIRNPNKQIMHIPVNCNITDHKKL